MDCRRNQSFKKGQKAYLNGKPDYENKCQPGTIFVDDWHDGWHHEANKRSGNHEIPAHLIVPMLRPAERAVLARLNGKHQTAKELATSGNLLFELADFRRNVRDCSPPTQLVTYDEEYKWRGWRITALGGQVRELLA